MKVKIVHFHENWGNQSVIYEVDGWDDAGKLAWVIEHCGCAVVSIKQTVISTPATQNKEKTQHMIRIYDNEMYKKELEKRYSK